MNVFPHRGKMARAGYVLLEVMLATTIFGLVAVALAVALDRTMDASLQLRRENSVAWNLESRLAEARIGKLVTGKQTLEPDAHGVAYEKEVTTLDLRTDHNEYLNGMYNVKITARWKQDNRDEELYAQTYVYLP